MYRIDDTPVHKAIRECLANTLVHADFYGRRGIRIEKRFRHITFANPGIFRLPLDVAVAGGTSDARNDVLFTLFALVEIGEKLGTGLVQLFSLWEQNGWARPEFVEQFDPERTFLTLDYNDSDEIIPQETFSTAKENNESAPETQSTGIETQKSGEENLKSGNENAENGLENNGCGNEKLKSGNENPGKIPGYNKSGNEKHESGNEDRLIYDIHKQEICLLEIIRNNPSISLDKLCLAAKLSKRTISRRLETMQKQGHLRRVGPDKGGHWEVLVV